MYIERLAINPRNNLVVLDDRNMWCRDARNFLEDKLKEAGCEKTLNMFVQIKLESKMFGILREKFSYLKPDSSLCVFPGRSASKIRERAEWHDYYKGPVFDTNTFVSVHADRRFDSFGNPVALAGEILPHRVVCPEVRTIVVIDDVISSGATCRKLYERNQHKFPKAEWHACSCVSRLEKIRGYKEIITALFLPLDERGLKVPINSLSTLLGEREIVTQYARKHCGKPELFLESLDILKSQFGECREDLIDTHLVPWRESVLNHPLY